MTPSVDANRPLSRLPRRCSVAALQDLGHQVDLKAAETFLLPETPPSTAKTVFTCAVDHYPRCTSTIR
ncbi:hypothetical protein ACIHFD_08745 [Nonomuraea sp. NPDC051941]|uniref:hypothetical protein n=1 Tax=Nonomuraea sp. NPDC051941 TaxID=3364373 RepID=UPI0037C5BC86